MKKWIKDGNTYNLYYTPFNEDILMIELTQSSDSWNEWEYTSVYLNILYDCDIFDSVEQAKKHCEDLVLSYLEKEAGYAKYRYEKWLNAEENEKEI